MKMRKYMLYIMWGLALLVMLSCHHTEIPVRSQNFLDQHFSRNSIILVEMDKDDEGMEYSVWLNDGTRVDFDIHGSWKRVARKKTGVPVELVPPAIMEYVKTHYPDNVVTKFSKKNYGYKLELSDDMDLRFNHQCQFIEEID